jgi:hypothetical protein
MLHQEWNYFKKHWKNPIFFLWLITSIYIFYKLWFLYIILIVCLFISILLLFIKKNPKIIIKKNKTSIFINYFKINILRTINNAKFNINFIPIFFFYYLFRIIFNMNYKIIKMSISLFDCFYNEYHWANIKKKKKSFKIINQYVKNSLEKWFYIEFIKITPKLEKELVIQKWGYKKTIKIIITHI